MGILTDYSNARPVGVEGLVYSAQRDTDRESRAAYAAIPFGRFVCRQDDRRVRLPAGAGDLAQGLLLGVAIYDASKAPGGYAQYDMVSLLHHGKIWMWAEEAVTEGGAVLIRHTANGGLAALGGVRTTANTGAAAAPEGIQFRTSTTAAGLVVVEINLPA